MVRKTHEGWIGYEKVRQTTPRGGEKVVAAQCKACNKILKGHTKTNLDAHKNVCNQQTGPFRKNHDGWAGFEKVRERTARGTEKVVAAQCKACEKILKGHTKVNLDAHKLICPKLANKPKLTMNGQKVIVINGMGQGQTIKMFPLVLSNEAAVDQKPLLQTLTPILPKPQPQIQPQIQPKTQPQIQVQIQPKTQPQIQLQIQPEIQPEAQLQIEPKIQPQIETHEEQPPMDRLEPLRELVAQLQHNQQQQLQLHQEQIEIQQNLWDTLLQVLEN